jgi:hypothetical protein
MRTIVMVDFALVAGALRSPCRDRRAIRTLPASFVSPNGIGAGAILFRRQKGSERKPPRNIPLLPELFRNSSGQRKRALCSGGRSCKRDMPFRDTMGRTLNFVNLPRSFWRWRRQHMDQVFRRSGIA